MLSAKLADAGLSALTQVGRTLAGQRDAADSLIGYTSSARVEPICLIDQAVVYNDMLPDVQQSLLSLFAGYYLQAWSLSANVGNVNVIRQLDKFNPNRDGAGAAAELGLSLLGDTLGMESYQDLKHRLPSPGDPRNYDDQVSMEAASTQSVKGFGDDLNKLSNLSVGKLVNVEIKDGANSATIAVSIRLLANQISSENLIHILSAGNEDRSLKERVHQWKSGEISLIKDLILCQDLIDEHKKHLTNDKEGFYQAILNRRTNNALASAVTGNYSVATASNLVVMSSDTQVQVEMKVGGRLKDFKTRQKIFEKTYLMILAVIDAGRNRVTFYHRGIPEATDLSHQDLKAANKSSGPDISDVLAAYRVGNSPSF